MIMKKEKDYSLIKLAILFLVLFLILIFASTSCVSKKITDKSRTEVQRSDSIRIETIRDTIYFEKLITKFVKDSSSEKSDENTIINFLPSGGSYNAETGEAKNVASVNISLQIKTLKTRVTMYEAQEKAWNSREQTLLDSIGKLNSVQQNDISEKTSVKSNWYLWLISGAVLMFALILFLKRFPYTSWLFKWI